MHNKGIFFGILLWMQFIAGIPMAQMMCLSCRGQGAQPATAAVADTIDTDTADSDITGTDIAVAVVLDSHADTPLEFDRGKRFGVYDPKVQVSLPRMRRGGVNAQYLACWVKQGPLTDSGRKAAGARVDRLLDLCRQQVAANDSACAIASTPAEVYSLIRDGKVAILLGVENGYSIGLDLDIIDRYKRDGVSYITLCHTRNNDICDSSSDPAGPRWRGLSDFGVKVVERMNELGMLIDLSHASEQTFWHVLRVSKAPVVCTHSGVGAVRRHDRNLTDKQLRALAEHGGVVQVCAVPGFLSATPKRASIDDFIKHLEHAIDIAGIDHVGVGTDFDGGGGVRGFNGSDDYANLAALLRKRGYSDTDIAKILGGNYMRVLTAVQSAPDPGR